MVSYVRARAEGLGLECKVGFMQRPERVVLTGLGALCCGIFAPMMENNETFEPIMIFVIPLLIRCDILQHHGIRAPEPLS